MQANPKRRAVAIPLRFGLAARTLRVVDLTSRYGIVVALCVIFGAPFLWVVSSSFNPNAELFQTTIRWLPVHFTLTNYRTIAGLLHPGDENQPGPTMPNHRKISFTSPNSGFKTHRKINVVPTAGIMLGRKKIVRNTRCPRRF